MTTTTHPRHMKKRVFAYVETKRVPRRTYGGSNYTLAVYELTGGNVERIGEVSACTAAHKGEASEAWSFTHCSTLRTPPTGPKLS